MYKNLSKLLTLNKQCCITQMSLQSKRTLFSFGKNDASDIKGHQIYEGNITKMVRYTKAFSVSSSIIGICMQPYLYTAMQEHSVILKSLLGSVIGTFILITPLAIHSITKRYVTRMHYDPATSQFTVSTLTFLVRDKHMTFTADEVNSEIMTSMFSNLEVKGKPLLIDPSCFSDNEAYIKLMGYDKPMDFQIKPKDNK